jgi:hypothetical protein
MLHEALRVYLERIEQAIERLDQVYVERYVEEILTPERVNLRIRLRTAGGDLLEIHEAVTIANGALTPLDYRYHCQDGQNRLRFRYDSTPHFPGLPHFPHHKHLADSQVVGTEKPDLLQVIQEAFLISE